MRNIKITQTVSGKAHGKNMADMMLLFFGFLHLLFCNCCLILFVAATYCDAQLAAPFNVRNEHITSLYFLTPKQVDSYNKVLNGVLKQWDAIKNAKYPIKSRSATEEKLQGESCANVEAVLPEKQFNLWKKNHGGNLATRFYKEDLGMTDEQFVKYRNISAVYANRKKEITRMNMIELENAECTLTLLIN